MKRIKIQQPEKLYNDIKDLVVAHIEAGPQSGTAFKISSIAAVIAVIQVAHEMALLIYGNDEEAAAAFLAEGFNTSALLAKKIMK